MFEKLKANISAKIDLIADGDKIPNVLLCTGIGDALGQPFEILKSDHPDLVKWDRKTFLSSRPRPPQYYGIELKLNPGQWTDDCQMSCIVAESLIDNKKFNPKDMSERYVDWIYSKRARGFGKSTKAAIDNLKNGIHWSKSGTEGSYGNGTAMRAAPFGVFYAKKDFSDMINAVKIDSAITHRSLEAEAGALAIAITTYLICRKEEDKLLSYLAVHLPESDVRKKIFAAHELFLYWHSKTHLDKRRVDKNYCMCPADHLKILGTGCDVRQTVPSALYLYWTFNRLDEAIITAILAGGDTDTTAAIAGAIIGAKTKLKDVHKYWVVNVENSKYLRDLDSKLYA